MKGHVYWAEMWFHNPCVSLLPNVKDISTLTMARSLCWHFYKPKIPHSYLWEKTGIQFGSCYFFRRHYLVHNNATWLAIAPDDSDSDYLNRFCWWASKAEVQGNSNNGPFHQGNRVLVWTFPTVFKCQTTAITSVIIMLLIAVKIWALLELLRWKWFPVLWQLDS